VRLRPAPSTGAGRSRPGAEMLVLFGSDQRGIDRALLSAPCLGSLRRLGSLRLRVEGNPLDAGLLRYRSQCPPQLRSRDPRRNALLGQLLQLPEVTCTPSFSVIRGCFGHLSIFLRGLKKDNCQRHPRSIRQIRTQQNPSELQSLHLMLTMLDRRQLGGRTKSRRACV